MEDLKTTFNPNDWVESSPDVFIESENSILKFAEDSITNSVDGEKHFILCKTAFLLGGYVGGNIISENEARNCLRDAISRKNSVRNLNSAFVTIDKCLDSGKQKPITEHVSNSTSNNHFQYFDYSNFSDSKVTKQFSEQEGLPNFPIDVFPESIQKLIITANDTVKFPVNFMGASILLQCLELLGILLK